MSSEYVQSCRTQEEERRKDITHARVTSTGLRVLQSLISSWKGEGEKNKVKKKSSQHGVFYLVTQPSANPAEQAITLVIRRDALLSLWYTIVIPL